MGLGGPAPYAAPPGSPSPTAFSGPCTGNLRIHRPPADDDVRVFGQRRLPVAHLRGLAPHNAPLFVIFAIISGGLSGANFPMTAALVADYWGETNNAVNYGSIYAWKALGGSFAGGGLRSS